MFFFGGGDVVPHHLLPVHMRITVMVWHSCVGVVCVLDSAHSSALHVLMCTMLVCFWLNLPCCCLGHREYIPYLDKYQNVNHIRWQFAPLGLEEQRRDETKVPLKNLSFPGTGASGTSGLISSPGGVAFGGTLPSPLSKWWCLPCPSIGSGFSSIPGGGGTASVTASVISSAISQTNSWAVKSCFFFF